MMDIFLHCTETPRQEYTPCLLPVGDDLPVGEVGTIGWQPGRRCSNTTTMRASGIVTSPSPAEKPGWGGAVDKDLQTGGVDRICLDLSDCVRILPVLNTGGGVLAIWFWQDLI